MSMIRDLMPTASHRLCYFHFCQANYRFATETCGLTYRLPRRRESRTYSPRTKSPSDKIPPDRIPPKIRWFAVGQNPAPDKIPPNVDKQKRWRENVFCRSLYNVQHSLCLFFTLSTSIVTDFVVQVAYKIPMSSMLKAVRGVKDWCDQRSESKLSYT